MFQGSYDYAKRSDRIGYPSKTAQIDATGLFGRKIGKADVSSAVTGKQRKMLVDDLCGSSSDGAQIRQLSKLLRCRGRRRGVF